MRGRNAGPSRHLRPKRRGSVLLVVMVVVMLLSLGAYTFSELMISERHAVASAGRGIQVRTSAQSGIEYAAALLADRANLTDQNLYHNPSLFRALPVSSGTDGTAFGWFTVAAPVETDLAGQKIRFGLMDESGKINLNALVRRAGGGEEVTLTGQGQGGGATDQGRAALMYLPGMTEEAADSILDFIDDDQTPRQFGAEGEYYSTLSPPYPPKDAPLESLDELLLVRGVTPWLLYGEDSNRNGLLDANENDGEASLPLDDGDGVLNPGWSAYLSVHSREANTRADGTPRINLNQSLLTELYDALEPEFGEDVAKFVVAYRTNGPVKEQGEGQTSRDGESSGSRSGGARSDGVGSGSSPQSNATGSGGEAQVLQQVAQSVSKAVSGGGGGAVTRGGIDLSKGATVQIQSIYDLVDAEVEVEVDGVKAKLGSPWTSESLDRDLPLLMDALSTTDAPFIEGRVNINQARLETLLGIPEMPEELARQIASSQMVGANGEPLTDTIAGRSTTGWLVTQGLTDVATMRKLDQYITARGDVYRAQVLGHLDAGGPVCRLEAVIDATQRPAKVMTIRDLTDLGRGIPRQQIQVAP